MLIKILYFIRISYKLLKRKYFATKSFCKECGRDVNDFSVRDDIWNKVDKTIKRGHVLCYDCFCKKCEQLNLPTVWELKDMDGGSITI